MPEDDVEYEQFIFISINFLLVNENKYYLQVYLDKCAYKIVAKPTTNYLEGNLIETAKYTL